MLELEFRAEDLANTKFAISPLWEIVASVRVLKAPSEHAANRPWAEWAQRSLESAGLDWQLLADLVPVPTRRIPGFLCPPPSTSYPGIETELAALAATDPATVRAGLDVLTPEEWTPQLRWLYDDPEAGLPALAAAIAGYWNVALRPYWPRIRTLLESDIRARAHLLAQGGARSLLNDLNSAISWESSVLSVAHRHVSGTRSLDGRGLLLVPSVFAWPRVFSVVAPGTQPALRYPPRGVARLWESRDSEPSRALAGVLGHSRAWLLDQLDVPRSTTELAERTGLSAGAVSQHLTALRDAGLVSPHRVRRHVLYARTSVSESLLEAAAG